MNSVSLLSQDTKDWGCIQECTDAKSPRRGHLAPVTANTNGQKRAYTPGSPIGNSFPSTHLTFMSLDSVRNLDHPQETAVNMDRI